MAAVLLSAGRGYHFGIKCQNLFSSLSSKCPELSDLLLKLKAVGR